MKKFSLILSLAIGLMLAGGTANSFAGNAANETTITGNMVCGKCTLHITKHCQNVVQVQKDGKTVNYFLTQNATSKEAHDPICSGGSEKVTVTGTVTEKDGKEVMTPSKIKVIKS